jgi:hypothetical protein
VASKNLRLDHPIPIAAQFTVPDGAGERRNCPPDCSLSFCLFGQVQPGLLSLTECGLGRSQIGAQSIHLQMVMRRSERLGDFVSLSLQFDHVLLGLA